MVLALGTNPIPILQYYCNGISSRYKPHSTYYSTIAMVLALGTNPIPILQYYCNGISSRYKPHSHITVLLQWY